MLKVCNKTYIIAVALCMSALLGPGTEVFAVSEISGIITTSTEYSTSTSTTPTSTSTSSSEVSGTVSSGTVAGGTGGSSSEISGTVTSGNNDTSGGQNNQNQQNNPPPPDLSGQIVNNPPPQNTNDTNTAGNNSDTHTNSNATSDEVASAEDPTRFLTLASFGPRFGFRELPSSYPDSSSFAVSRGGEVGGAGEASNVLALNGETDDVEATSTATSSQVLLPPLAGGVFGDADSEVTALAGFRNGFSPLQLTLLAILGFIVLASTGYAISRASR